MGKYAWSHEAVYILDFACSESKQPAPSSKSIWLKDISNWPIIIDREAGEIIRLVASVRGHSNIYDDQSKVVVCVCYLLLFRQVGRLRSITLLIYY